MPAFEWQTNATRDTPQFVTEAVVQRCSATLLKKRLWHGCFPVSFAKFLRTPILQNTSGCFCC